MSATDDNTTPTSQPDGRFKTYCCQVLLTKYQSPDDKQNAIEKIRQLMPPPMKASVSFRKKNGMRSPIMSDAESIHRSDLDLNGRCRFTNLEIYQIPSRISPLTSSKFNIQEPPPRAMYYCILWHTIISIHSHFLLNLLFTYHFLLFIYIILFVNVVSSS